MYSHAEKNTFSLVLQSPAALHHSSEPCFYRLINQFIHHLVAELQLLLQRCCGKQLILCEAAKKHKYFPAARRNLGRAAPEYQISDIIFVHPRFQLRYHHTDYVLEAISLPV